jgi:hypothetical protein
MLEAMVCSVNFSYKGGREQVPCGYPMIYPLTSAEKGVFSSYTWYCA